MHNKLILESLSMDLLRVALGLHRGSHKMAERFSEEALHRTKEVNTSELKPYLQQTLHRVTQALHTRDQQKKSEDALMYSTIVRNYCLTFLKN